MCLILELQFTNMRKTGGKKNFDLGVTYCCHSLILALSKSKNKRNKMMNSVTTSTQQALSNKNIFVAPLLKRIKKESAQEYTEMQQAFDLLSWGSLPDELKIEIYNDVRFMVQELKGMFSSCDPYVQRRRESVLFWVQSFQDGICSLETTIKALKVKSL
jgi:hypothetical protein